MHRHKRFWLLILLCLSDLTKDGGTSQLRRTKRSATTHVSYDDLNPEDFQPIRISVKRGVTTGLDATQIQTLDDVVGEAVKRIQSAVAVHRVQGRLFLARPAGCKFSHLHGINKNRCAEQVEGYNGDFCLDDFRIPDEDQVSLKIYDDSNRHPVKIVHGDGVGLVDTDLVLYVQARSTLKCVQEKVVAYAQHCQQDQNQRPVAAYANFCPDEFLSSDIQYAIKTATHELVHALGFAADLFRLFQTCSPDKCPLQRLIQVHSGPQEKHRLVSPTLTALLRKHFQCQKSDFGALLHPGPTDDTYSSHWDPLFLQGSLMTPAIDRFAYLTLFDSFTLAVLQDTGWYRVNFSSADPYLWGKGKGCDFGMYSDPKLTCTEHEPGCHYLHMDKAVCSVIPGAGNIQVAHQSCLYDSVASTTTQDPNIFHFGERFSSQSRCFMARIVNKTSNVVGSPTSLIPHCFRHRCNTTRNIPQVEVDFGIGWFHCPYGQRLAIDSIGFGLTGKIECPSYGPLCGDFQLNLDSLPHISPPVTTARPVELSTPESSSSSSPVVVGLVFGHAFQPLYDAPAYLLMLISKVEEFIVEAGLPHSSFDKPKPAPYFNDSLVVLVNFRSTSQLPIGVIMSRLREHQGEAKSLNVYNVPFVTTGILHLPSTAHLPPSPLDNTSPPSKTPVYVAAISGAVAAILILLIIGLCFRHKAPKRTASMTSAGGVSIPPAGVYPLNSRTLFLSNSEVDNRSLHHPYHHSHIPPHHLQHMEMATVGQENPLSINVDS